MRPRNPAALQATSACRQSASRRLAANIVGEIALADRSLSAQSESDFGGWEMPARMRKRGSSGQGSWRVTVLTRSIDSSKERIASTPVASAWATR